MYLNKPAIGTTQKAGEMEFASTTIVRPVEARRGNSWKAKGRGYLRAYREGPFRHPPRLRLTKMVRRARPSRYRTQPYTFHPEAEAESGAAFQYYFARSPDAAFWLRRSTSRRLSDASKLSADLPPYFDGTRRALLDGYPFSVVFRDACMTFRSLLSLTPSAGPAIGLQG